MKKRIPGYFKILVGVLVVLGIIVLSALLNKINSLDIESEEVQTLYAYLGDNYLDYCDGMPFYNDSEVTFKNLKSDTKMCLAYKLISDDEIEQSSLKKAKKSDACTFTKDKQFRLDDDAKTCTTEVIKQETVESVYNALFGENIKEHSDFSLSGSKACYYEKEQGIYTCGNVLVQTIELGWAPTTYRMITKAKEKGNKIMIYDYYLAINNERCYLNNFGSNENEKCSEKINNKTDITSRLVYKYGRKYVHTFASSKNGNYYWISSSPVD